MSTPFRWDLLLASILVSVAILVGGLAPRIGRSPAIGRYQLGPGFKTGNTDGSTSDYWVVLDTTTRDVTYVRGYLATEPPR
jgi:hypothetical protein